MIILLMSSFKKNIGKKIATFAALAVSVQRKKCRKGKNSYRSGDVLEFRRQ